MDHGLKTWFFYAALFLFLPTLAVTLPSLEERFFGETEQQLASAVSEMETRAEAVWEQLSP